MKLDIESNIVDYLRRNGKVSIPGLGSFSIANLSDDFVLQNHVLSPPKGTIVFSENGNTKDPNFAQYLSNVLGISKSKAKTGLKKYGQELLNSLLNYGATNIEGVGKLYKSSDKEIKFESVDIKNSAKYFHLPTINLTPLDPSLIAQKATSKATPLVAPVAATTTIATKAVDNDKVVSGSINDRFASSTETSNSSTPNKKIEKAIPKPVETIVDTPSYTATDHYEEESAFKRWFWPFVAVITFLALLFFGFKACNNYLKDQKITDESGLATTEGDSAEDMSNEQIEGSDILSDFEAMVADDTILSKYADFLTPQIVESGCIIIVGSFKKPQNAIQMRSKIISAELDPYSETYGDYTRVGIRFECADHDLIDNIKKIRNQFDKKAWYLQPDMEVAY